MKVKLNKESDKSNEHNARHKYQISAISQLSKSFDFLGKKDKSLILCQQFTHFFQ